MALLTGPETLGNLISRTDEDDEIRRLLRRCAIELAYINHGVENCNSGLCATSEGRECIEEAERLLGPMRDWPEVKE